MNSFNLKWEVIKSFPLIYLDGSITLGAKQLLEKTYDEIIDQVKSKGLIFDFTKIDYINSSGISYFLNIINLHNETGMELIFVSLPDHIKKVFDVVGLMEYVKVFGTVDMAIKYCYNELGED